MSDSRTRPSQPVPSAEALSGLFSPDPSCTLIIVAHPDDEVIGAAAVLMHPAARAIVLHVTDGAPRDLIDARRAGCASAAEYACIREAEARAALALAGGAIRLDCLNIPDQTATRSMPDLALRLYEIMRDVKPARVLTHAYEGGHPDHDAVAFAAAQACRAYGVPIIEMTGYFDDANGITTGRFSQAHLPELTRALNRTEQDRKQRMMNCFRSQADTLRMFEASVERYRIAPAYDFSRLPNRGRVLYDRYSWGLSSRDWPALVDAANQQLAHTLESTRVRP